MGRDESLRIVGIDLFRAAEIQPALIPSVADRLDVLDPDVLFVSGPAAAWLGIAPGDRVTLQAGADPVVVRVAGALGSGVAQRLAIMDIAGVQTHFDRVGMLSRIDLRVRAGYDVDTVAR